MLDLVQGRQVGAETGVAHLDAAELALDAAELRSLVDWDRPEDIRRG
jgi:hypothetical protein